MVDRPSGAATFLFTDVPGSTGQWERDPKQMEVALEVLDRVLRDVIDSKCGFVFATGGGSFAAAFGSPSGALRAAVDAQRALETSGCGLSVRMGVHSEEAVKRDGNYYGPALNRTARLMSIGHGGQILVSSTTTRLVASAGFEFRDLGEHRLADLAEPEQVSQLDAAGLCSNSPKLNSVVAMDNLPLIGEVCARHRDIDTITELLSDSKLVTLTGAGGIGKTTLAICVADRLRDRYDDGCWLVDLTDLPSVRV